MSKITMIAATSDPPPPRRLLLQLQPTPLENALIGHDVSRHTLSWGRSVGAIVATTQDMTRWERALYTGRLLPRKQQAELTSLVSTRTGEPIERTTPQDPSGFGLGVGQKILPGLGAVWTYEGTTWGFRAQHVYFPNSKVGLAVTLNSLPTDSRSGQLLTTLHNTLVAHGVLTAPTSAAQPSR